METRTLRVLDDADITRVSSTYHVWRSRQPAVPYVDLPGFCKVASLDEITSHDFILTPGRYVGAEDIEGDGEPFEEKMTRLVATLEQQFVESARLEAAIRQNLKLVSYG